MKRMFLKLLISVIVVSIIATFSIVGCKDSAAETEVAETEVAETEVAETEAEPEVVAEEEEIYVMIVPVYTVPWWLDGRWGWEDAAKFFGVTVEFTGIEGLDPVQLAAVIDQVAARGDVDGIAVSAVDPKALNSTIDRVIDSGMPLITYCDDTDGSKRLSYVGLGLEKMGLNVAEEIAKEIDYKGEVGVSYGGPETSMEIRLDAHKKVFAKYPDIELVEVVSDEYDLNKGIAAVSGMLQAHPNLAGITGLDATSGACIAQALIESGKNKGDIKVVAVDNNNDVLQYIKDGWIQSSITANSYVLGFNACAQLYFYNHAKELMPQMIPSVDILVESDLAPLPDTMYSSVIKITADNADLFFKE